MKRYVIIAVGIAAAAVTASAQTSTGDFKKTRRLPEVTVRLKPIEQVKDTINYNVAAFQGKDDHYLEDVLKKMPGIEVAANGVITYKGEMINQLNIEGQNLLGNRYSQATRNLPVEAISQVQVMENDQPIRALKSTVPSDKATLNIKLKSGYKIRPFGEVEIGGGGFDKALWSNRLSVINIAAKNQLMVTANMNNTGESYKFSSSKSINAADLDSYVALPKNAVRPFASFIMPLPGPRYVDNKSNSVSVNHLRRLGKYGSLRTNVNFYNESDNLTDSLSYLYGGAHTLSLLQSNRSQQREYTVVPKLQYEHNSPSLYLTDDLTASLSYQTDNTATNSSGRLLEQSTFRHPSFVQNRLAATVSVGRHTYNVASALFYFRRSESLGVDDADNLYTLAERMVFRRFITDNTISTSLPFLGNVLNLRYSINYGADGMNIDAAGYNDNSYLLNTFAPNYTLRYKGGFLSLDCPLNYYSASILWRTADGKVHRFYFSPSFKLVHHFSPLWRLTLSGAFRQSQQDDIITPTTYRSDYRTLTTTPDRFGWSRSSNMSLLLNYSNIADMFMWQLLSTMSWNSSELRYAYNIKEDYTMVTPLWESTHSRFLMAQMRSEKTFLKPHVALQGVLSYSRNEIPIVQNGQSSMVKSNTVSASLKLRWYHLKWIQLTDEATFNLAWQDRFAGSQSTALKSVYNEFRLTLSPFRKVTVEADCDYSLLETARGEYKSLVFADAKVYYTPAKKWNIIFSLRNAFNRRRYVDASYTGFNYRYYSMPLRGREAVVSVKYKF